MIKVSANKLDMGSVFKYENSFWKLKDKTHQKLGKGGACLQIDAVNIVTSVNRVIRINVDQTIDLIYMDRLDNLSYSYTDGDTVVFLKPDYNQIEIQKSDLGKIAPIFDENVDIENIPNIKISCFEDNGLLRIIDAELMDNIIVKIVETNPSIKGETATNRDKPAITEGNIHISVPPYLNIGDEVFLNKTTLEYQGRVNQGPKSK